MNEGALRLTLRDTGAGYQPNTYSESLSQNTQSTRFHPCCITNYRAQPPESGGRPLELLKART